MQARKEDRSLGDLFTDLTREMSTLVRQEVTLARTEMTQKATQVGKDVGFMAAGGVVALIGVLAIVTAVILLLANVMWPWLAALIVGAVIAIVGYVFLQQGMTRLKHVNLAPEQTIATIKEDAQWAKDQTK